ncbi:hypothetical protein EDC54_101615 [Samsonia erythrinae]|uniref:Uncharacterized protein n=1 Tax=Samsonia erythrinae TaxID=160434 RepID=A0A4R3VT74_9GAMM|nr:hypothetical protein EDC54_101615 [Samsonia erythrinae]
MRWSNTTKCKELNKTNSMILDIFYKMRQEIKYEISFS